MAYNTNTDRLLDAIKTNTSNITVTATSDNTTLETLVGNGNATLTNIETNSNTSLGKNGFTYHAASLLSATSGRAAVQFVLESVVADIELSGTSTGIAGTIPAGTIIYGDITNVTLSSSTTGGFILYNE